MKSADLVLRWIREDPVRWRLLGHVKSLALPDCWIAAGFVRNAVWSILHGREPMISGDVDVIWFDSNDPRDAVDRSIETRLREIDPSIDWSVKNQARMHVGNGDNPYASSADAMLYWPETATAVAVRRTLDDECEIRAPFGVDDLLGLKLRPAGAFATRKRAIFDERVRSKRWLVEFPRLELVA